MIALKKNVFRWAAAEFEENFDDISRGRSAIDVVAHEHHCIAACRGDCAEHRREFVDTAMDIADCE